MTDRQIRCFLEAARTLNFTRAAENLYTPQPAVSRYIASLEEELGHTLFIRTNNRNISLSPAGKLYYNIFMRFIKDLDSAQEKLDPDHFVLTIGFPLGWNVSSFLPDVLNSCREFFPQMEIRLESRNFTDLIDAIENGSIDVILTLENAIAQFPELQYEHITQVRRCFIYSSRVDPDGCISEPSDLADIDFFMPENGKSQELSRDVISLCREWNFSPRIVSVPTNESVLANVENGIGVAMWDEWGLDMLSPNIKILWLDIFHPVCAAWCRTDNPVAVRRFRKELRKVCK